MALKIVYQYPFGKFLLGRLAYSYGTIPDRLGKSALALYFCWTE
jgi:hypothetical protein